MIITGRVHIFGDGVSTDAIHPTKFFSTEPARIVEGAMAGMEEGFHRKVSRGDVIIAGRSFGSGSGREIAPLSLKLAGIDAVIAVSMPRIFFRNCVNVGILPIIADVRTAFSPHDRIRIDTDRGVIENLDTGAIIPFEPPDARIMGILEAGGLMKTL